MNDSTADSGGAQAQILLKLGEMSTQLAVITEVLKVIPDHEARIRALERFRFTILGACAVIAGLSTYLGYLVGHRR